MGGRFARMRTDSNKSCAGLRRGVTAARSEWMNWSLGAPHSLVLLPEVSRCTVDLVGVETNDDSKE
jgi:hypothetical protein